MSEFKLDCLRNYEVELEIRFFKTHYLRGIKCQKPVHFDVPADDPERVNSFYAKLFGCKFERPMEAME